MADINKKSLIVAIGLGFAAWMWAFIIVGSAFFDYTTNQPITNPDMGVYATVLIINTILTIVILSFYILKYEQSNPIISDNWRNDAIILGVIICAINFLLDALFFGIMGRNLIAYFWLESTTGYMYPLIIIETWIIAYLIYGKK